MLSALAFLSMKSPTALMLMEVSPAGELRHASFRLAELDLSLIPGLPVMSKVIAQGLRPEQVTGVLRLGLLRIIRPFLQHVEAMYAPSAEISSEVVLDAILRLGDKLLDPQVRHGMIFAMTVAKGMLDTGSSLTGLAANYCTLSLSETLDLVTRAFAHDELQPIKAEELLDPMAFLKAMQASFKEAPASQPQDRGLVLPA